MGVFENALFIYGGYSKEKAKLYGEAKGVIHTDMWTMNLANTKLSWEKPKKGGIPPSQRSGMSTVLDKKRMIVFGGVFDEETEENLTNSVFYNDLFAFHMDAKRWFKVTLHIKGEKKKRVKKPKDNKKEEKEEEDEQEEMEEEEEQSTQKEEQDDEQMEEKEEEEEEQEEVKSPKKSNKAVKNSKQEVESDEEEKPSKKGGKPKGNKGKKTRNRRGRRNYSKRQKETT